ncbi:MAG: hypothetical protein A3K90_08705 [Pelodictyon luteolum]|uniref:Acyltransferase 3 domain-containing protein n=2 Tax=Pelodictyon luteolum TaxID=1100 RepID=A0A165LU31_PELLU|nr:MAG: hypothetical protein A3K90_08705 [Pelodictyon luteolum]
MSGGFVGVDVFFVISGYLITSILIEEIENDHFSIIDFYERRARRILPPLFAVTLVTTPAVFLLLSPEAIVDYGKSLLSLSVFASNVYFALTGGYFANNVAAKPLLHTWSLSVEEQFYLFFPLLMLVWKSQSKNAQLSIISLLSLISFLISVVLVTMYPRIAFFGIPSRAWELGIGAVIATLMVQNKIPPPFLKAPLAFIGLVSRHACKVA